jgi:hypothetical protein
VSGRGQRWTDRDEKKTIALTPALSACWLQVQDADVRYAQGKNLSFAET